MLEFVGVDVGDWRLEVGRRKVNVGWKIEKKNPAGHSCDSE